MCLSDRSADIGSDPWQHGAVRVPKGLTTAVAEAFSAVLARIPGPPAADLGRHRFDGTHDQHQTLVQAAQRSLGPLLATRLLGALELTVAELHMGAPGGLTTGLVQRTSGMFAFLSSNDEPETTKALSLLEITHPGATDLVVELTRYLAREAGIRELLTVDPEVTGEQEIMARHGRAYLALAVTTASAVLRELDVDSPAVIGTALGAAVLVLREAPEPPAYAAAMLDKRRAEYLVPRMSTVQAEITDSRYALAERGVPPEVDFTENGLVAAIPGGLAVRVGAETGRVPVGLSVLAEPPSEVMLAIWDEVVEVSWTADTGFATITGGRQEDCAPPWPGEYRARVHARGRDGDDAERYEVVVWSAPAAPPIVHKRTDRLGHRLRGEAEPPVVLAPEAEFRWIEQSQLSVAATVTVVDGLTAEEVVAAFGADPEDPLSLWECLESGDWTPAVAVQACDGVVFAVEVNGFQGSNHEVLRALSRNGRAASMFWNVNALTQLSFARGGEVLWAEELLGELPASEDPEVARALAGLDFEDHRHLEAKGVTAVARFTGRGPTEREVDRLLYEDVGYQTP